MTKDIGRRQFTYAVITDTHLNQGETECNSPFKVNKLANGRMRHVVRDLNNKEVDFVIHLDIYLIAHQLFLALLFFLFYLYL